MGASRTKKAAINTLCELTLELVTAICSFILPRLILIHFGSAYNGITQSITQFIGCIALFKSGIGSVTRAALYAPLAQNDNIKVSEVVRATEHFLRRVAVIFVIGVVLFAAVYPYLVSNEFDWFFTFSLVLILSISTLAQYYFGLTYQMVLQADQDNYIISFVQIIATIVNTIIASVLITMGAGIHVVKLGSALVFVLPPLFFMFYAKKKYAIDRSVTPKLSLLSQRWDAFGHQLANFANTNVDVMLVTIFLGVKAVSVYSIYYMVANAVKKILTSIATGTTAAFGNMLAKKEYDRLRKRFGQYEILILFLSTVLFSITAIMIVPFMALYTEGVSDINYSRPDFAILVSLAEFFICFKTPYQQLVYAAGAFKRTKADAYRETILHIVVSIVCMYFWKLNGVLVGCIVATVFRTIRYHVFISDNLVARPRLSIIKQFVFAIVVFLGSFMLTKNLAIASIGSYIEWIIMACIVALITFIPALLLVFVMFRDEAKGICGIALRVLRKGGEHA